MAGIFDGETVYTDAVDPVRQWQDQQDALVKAKALLLANTSAHEREPERLRLRGGLTGAHYAVCNTGRDTGPARVQMVGQDGEELVSFCVYTANCMARPIHDEKLAMAFYIKYYEAEFLAEAVPHPMTRRALKLYLEACERANVVNRYNDLRRYAQDYMQPVQVEVVNNWAVQVAQVADLAPQAPVFYNHNALHEWVVDVVPPPPPVPVVRAEPGDDARRAEEARRRMEGIANFIRGPGRWF